MSWMRSPSLLRRPIWFQCLTPVPTPSHVQPKPTTNSSGRLRGQSCHAKVDVMFMKTHKTASSTFINTLFRFGEKHRLKFAFPDSGNDFFYPSLFECFHLKDYRPGMCFNIIYPAELFESSFRYFGRLVPFTWRIPSDDKLTYFYRFNSFYLKNLLFFDFGQDNNLNLDDPCVEEGMQLIFDRFQLVMLDTLCWEMDDLLFFKLNVRKGSSVSKLTPELKARALEWNAIDWKLYQHFNKTFCGHAVDKSTIGYNMKRNVDKAHQKTCRKMLMPEIQYLTELGVNLLITKLWGKVHSLWLPRSKEICKVKDVCLVTCLLNNYVSIASE
uniref:Galactose-3-O-sulfotransferase 1a n=1 Tax=Cynoglossus semilaevis TaxID=244447 RepID=A0A3P8VZ97_CYNSE